MQLQVSGQYVRYQIGTQVHLGTDKHHFFGGVLVQPAANHRPDGREYRGRVQHKAHAQPLRVVFAQQPNDVLHQLVVHAGRAELGQVENNAEVIGHLFEAFIARSLLEW